VCNATNALFFWAFLPETNKTPLEYMDKLWQEAPLFIPAWHRKDYFHELEEKAAHIDEKTAAPIVVEEV
jgi:hypothetical protein